METYHRDIEDVARSTGDAEGHPSSDADAARSEALQALAEVLLHEPSHLDHRKVTCTVRTGDGGLVYRASLSLDGHRADRSPSVAPTWDASFP